MNSTPSTYLFPRLDAHSALRILEDQRSMTLVELRGASSLGHPDAVCAPSGGHPVTEGHLAMLQRSLREISEDFGFPEPLKQAKQGEFDRISGTVLFRDMRIVPADAAEEGVWSFMSLVLVPEIAVWRFPDRHQDRLLGKRRNALRRLWWRACVLGPDLTAIPPGAAPLNEDEFVQIMERPTIARNFRLAKGIQTAMWKLDAEQKSVSRNEVLRELTKIVRAERSHIAMDVFGDEMLSSYFDELASEIADRHSHVS